MSKQFFCIYWLFCFLVIVKCSGKKTGVCPIPITATNAELVNNTYGRQMLNENDILIYRCINNARNFTSNQRKICQGNGNWLGDSIECHQQQKCRSKFSTDPQLQPCTLFKSTMISFIQICFRGPFPSSISGEQEGLCHFNFDLSSPDVQHRYCTGQIWSCQNIALSSAPQLFDKWDYNIQDIQFYYLQRLGDELVNQTNEGEGKVSIAVAVLVFLIFLCLAMIVFIIWIKKRQRFCFSKRRPTIPTVSFTATEDDRNIVDEENLDNTVAVSYENIITLNVNPRPSYAQLDFPKPSIYAFVNKKKKYKNLQKACNNRNNGDQHSSESQVTYAAIQKLQ